MCAVFKWLIEALLNTPFCDNVEYLSVLLIILKGPKYFLSKGNHITFFAQKHGLHYLVVGQRRVHLK